MSSARRTSQQEAPPHQEESLKGAIIGGLIGALIGTVVWTLIGAISGHTFGIIALGVGGLTGFGVRIGGNGSNPIYPIIAAGFAVGGCLIGNVMIIAIYISQRTGVSFLKLVLNPKLPFVVLKHSSFQTFIFFALAVYMAWRFATQEEVD
jgi:hypothetical protein